MPGATAPSDAARILVVDDDDQIRSFVHDVLVEEGFVVDTAANGAAATARGTAAPPDLVVLDMMLPDMRGEDVADALHARLGDELPILVITADTSASEKARRTSAYGYLRKPFDLDDFLKLVDQGLQRT